MAVAAAGVRAVAMPVTGSVAAAGAMDMAAVRAMAMATVGAVPMAGPRARASGRLGGWRRGLLHRGHRPIIARTSGAHCSPRHI
ncbi:hypothetical protein STRIP9103_04757 [Streptomyces ipomoeae 91-03]|uniref:Uncharacterized protein n=1 Tax=Streptomyces ipomoeae 91-03 TaxID=698759 RepID=L1KNN2_9ACTN|nr:hypothetical protein STRIP9103_04757 [Streptomyces ipomoeae 91-03]